MSWQALKWAVGQSVGSGPEISAGPAKAVLLILAEAANGRTGASFLSQATIAGRAEIGERTVLRALDLLEQKGLIRRSRRSAKRGQRTTDLVVLLMGDQPASAAAREASAKPPGRQVGSRSPNRQPVKAYPPASPNLTASLAEEPVIEPEEEPEAVDLPFPTQRFGLRSNVTNPRATGTNPRSKGTNPRARRQATATALPDDFPDADAKRRMADRFAQEGLSVDVEIQAERFRIYFTDICAASWPGRWATWTLTGIERARERAQHGGFPSTRHPQRWSASAQAAAGYIPEDEEE